MKVVVVGGNAAGMSFAAKYKRNQPSDDVIVIEKRDYISFGGCGLPYFAGGFFDDTERMISRTPEQAIASISSNKVDGYNRKGSLMVIACPIPDCGESGAINTTCPIPWTTSNKDAIPFADTPSSFVTKINACFSAIYM